MLLAGTPVTIRALKYDGREYRRWEAAYSAAVSGGMVLETIFSAVVERRKPFFGGDRAMEYFYTDRGCDVIAGYAPNGSLHACYCNICTPAQFTDTPTGAEFSFVDLDLALLIWPAGRCELTDEAEFAQNSVRYGYPQEVQAAARAAVSALQHAVCEQVHNLRPDRSAYPFLMPHNRRSGYFHCQDGSRTHHGIAF